MEKFTLMSSTPNDPSKVNRICWYDPGTDAPATLLSSTNDCIRQWEVDPNVRCESWADARWGGGVMDMVVNQSKQLVVGTVKDEYFSVHAVELENLPKRGGMVGRAGAGVGGESRKGTGNTTTVNCRSSSGALKLITLLLITTHHRSRWTKLRAVFEVITRNSGEVEGEGQEQG